MVLVPSLAPSPPYIINPQRPTALLVIFGGVAMLTGGCCQLPGITRPRGFRSFQRPSPTSCKTDRRLDGFQPVWLNLTFRAFFLSALCGDASCRATRPAAVASAAPLSSTSQHLSIHPPHPIFPPFLLSFVCFSHSSFLSSLFISRSYFLLTGLSFSHSLYCECTMCPFPNLIFALGLQRSSQHPHGLGWTQNTTCCCCCCC